MRRQLCGYRREQKSWGLVSMHGINDDELHECVNTLVDVGRKSGVHLVFDGCSCICPPST